MSYVHKIKCRSVKKDGGFSLVEIMVVVGLIGVIATIVIANASESRQQARMGKAKTELKTIQLAMESYREQTGQMPGTQTVSAEWQGVVGQVQAVVPVTLPQVDPWGNPYRFDNNYLVDGRDNPTVACSPGPNGRLETETNNSSIRGAVGDDVCVFIPDPDDVAAEAYTPPEQGNEGDGAANQGNQGEYVDPGNIGDGYYDGVGGGNENFDGAGDAGLN